MTPLRAALAALLTLAIVAGPAVAQTTPAAPAATAATTVPEITAEQAGPGVLLDAADRVELAGSLAGATEESGVCFGYVVSLSGSGASDRTETLSGSGPDREPSPCPDGTVLLQVGLTYTSESSEAEDSSSFSVRTDVAELAGSPVTQRLKDLAGVDEGDLLGGKDDQALRNLTAALPLLLNDATPAELPAPAATAPNGDRLTGSPGSDWLREHWLGVGVGVLLLLLALVLVAGGLAARRRSGRPRRPTRPTPLTARDDGPSSGSSTTTIP